MIGYAKQKSNSVDVYDEHGKFLFNKCGQVVGYTSATVSIKSNTGTTWLYNEQGRCLFGK